MALDFRSDETCILNVLIVLELIQCAENYGTHYSKYLLLVNETPIISNHIIHCLSVKRM